MKVYQMALVGVVAIGAPYLAMSNNSSTPDKQKYSQEEEETKKKPYRGAGGGVAGGDSTTPEGGVQNDLTGHIDPSTLPAGSIPDGYGEYQQSGTIGADSDGGTALVGETTHQSMTSMTDANGKYINSDKVAYIAQNPDANGNYPYRMGTIVYVRNNDTHQIVPAILSENATANNLNTGRVEGSSYLNQQLGTAKYNSKGEMLDKTNDAHITVFYPNR